MTVSRDDWVKWGGDWGRYFLGNLVGKRIAGEVV